MPTNPAQSTGRSRPHFLCVAVCVAGLANALVPAVFFADTALFGHTDARYRIAVGLVVLVEYAIAFLLLRLHANAAFASGYAVATAAIVTVVSAALAVLVVGPAHWDRNALYAEVFTLGGLAFAVFTNLIFLLAGIRYARRVHPRLHIGGFVLGIAASLLLLFMYVRILP